jgi:glycosyltransferase involved in cell wall biosynthesis
MAVTSDRRIRLGVLVTHPIQYFAPWFRQLAERLDVEVFYAHRQDSQGQAAAGFGTPFEWDVPLLDGYPHHWLNNVSRKPGLAHFAGCDTPELADLIRPDRFDAFLVTGWSRKCHWQAIRTCWRQRVPVLMRGDSQRSTARSRFKRMLKAIPYRWFLPRLDAHLYVGQRNREYLQHYRVADQQLFFCPHFVDNAFFARRAAEARADGRSAAIRAQCGANEDSFIVLFVGKFIDVKRPQKFVQAVIEAARINPRIRGIMVGSGPLEAECRRLTGDSPHLSFAGFQNQRQLPAYYAAADLLVLPSATETWGLVVNEAMACGTPCLVNTACGCTPDLIADNVTGFLFDGPAGESLTQPLLRAATQSPSQRDGMRRQMAEILQRYSMDAATDGLIAAVNWCRDRTMPGVPRRTRPMPA